MNLLTFWEVGRTLQLGQFRKLEDLNWFPNSPPWVTRTRDLAVISARWSQYLNTAIKDRVSETLGQLRTEEDDEVRFQNDLNNALRQSLDENHKLPLISSSGTQQEKLPEIRKSCPVDAYGTGLKNSLDEYSCFLNVIIQSLWHVRRFRYEFERIPCPVHIHVGKPCLVCSLHEIIIAMSIPNKKRAVPTDLRVALSNVYPGRNFFKKDQMNDSSEVLEAIYISLHQAFTVSHVVSNTNSVDTNCVSSWGCTNGSCIAHDIFGMDIVVQLKCRKCGLESQCLKYTTFFHNMNAMALRTAKVTFPDVSFDEFLCWVQTNDTRSCDYCGELNCIHHVLSTPPRVFTTVIGWQNMNEHVDDIKSTLSILSSKINISALFRDLHSTPRYGLVSMVCHYGFHYQCFAYFHEHERWVLYDDTRVEVIGSWNDVVTVCAERCLQPQVLIFEAE